jgi:hypothetical protein
MPLSELRLAPTQTMPGDVLEFLHEAERRIEQLQQHSPAHAFVPSDHAGAYRMLQALTDSALARGTQFCEWGSGLGVVTCLAAMAGFEACGIEIESELVDAARRLAEDFDIAAQFVCGSFIPPGGERHLGEASDFAWLTPRADDLSGELGVSPDEVDVVYAYPWPDEEDAVSALFERYASPEALLLTYHGGEEFRLRRKMGRNRKY